MLLSYREAVCWLFRHEGSVLVLSADHARLVAGTRAAEGLRRTAALALTMVASRRRWFDVEAGAGRPVLKLNGAGRKYHERLVDSSRCACRAARSTGSITPGTP